MLWNFLLIYSLFIIVKPLKYTGRSQQQLCTLLQGASFIIYNYPLLFTYKMRFKKKVLTISLLKYWRFHRNSECLFKIKRKKNISPYYKTTLIFEYLTRKLSYRKQKKLLTFTSSYIRNEDFRPDFSLLLRQTCATPPEIWDGVDWRALVELRTPDIGKLRGCHFFTGNLFCLSTFLSW